MIKLNKKEIEAVVWKAQNAYEQNFGWPWREVVKTVLREAAKIEKRRKKDELQPVYPGQWRIK